MPADAPDPMQVDSVKGEAQPVTKTETQYGHWHSLIKGGGWTACLTCGAAARRGAGRSLEGSPCSGPVLSSDAVPRCGRGALADDSSHHDCQPLEQISCGHVPLLNAEYRPLLQRTLANLADVVAYGRWPPTMRCDPVVWAKREFNTVADFLSNLSMDVRKDSWREVKRGPVSRNSNVVVFSDGGTRKSPSDRSDYQILLMFLHFSLHGGFL